MRTTEPPLPGPATVVDCPWCADPVELEPNGTELVCVGCHVTVDLAPDPMPLAGRRAA